MNQNIEDIAIVNISFEAMPVHGYISANMVTGYEQQTATLVGAGYACFYFINFFIDRILFICFLICVFLKLAISR